MVTRDCSGLRSSRRRLDRKKRRTRAKLQSSYCKDNHFLFVSSAYVKILVFEDVGSVSLRTLVLEHKHGLFKTYFSFMCFVLSENFGDSEW